MQAMLIPDWLWQSWVGAATVAAVRWAWKHKEKLEDWYYIASYQLTKPFKPPPRTTATLTVQVAGCTRSRRNPYTGEWEISRTTFKTDEDRG